MFSLSSQTPSQPNNFFGVSLVAFCDCISNAQSAGNGSSQSVRPDSSPISMLRSNRLPSGDTSIRPSPLISPFGTILLIFLRAHRAVEADLVNVRHVLAKNRLPVARPNRRVTRHFILHARLEHVEIRAVRIHDDKIPDFVRTRGEKDLLPVSCPTWVIRIIARHVFEHVYLSAREFDDGDMTRVRRLARFLRCVKRDASSIRRDRREDAVRDLSLICAIEVGYPDSLVSFKRDVPIAAKN